MRCPKGSGASHTLEGVLHAPHLFLNYFLYLVKYQITLSWLNNNNKKNHYEKIKKPFDSNFKIFTFKSILVISLYFLIIFLFFIFGQILNFS
jgi:hypothetical protein